MKIALLTGGIDKPYAFGLATRLARLGVEVEMVGSDEMEGEPALREPGISFLNLRGSMDPRSSLPSKVWRILLAYGRILAHAARTDARLAHILWLNRFPFLDRTLLLAWYRLWGKRVVFTAHNVNDRRRDGGDTRLHRWSLRHFYRGVDHVMVHTARMRDELTGEYGVDPERATVVPIGLYDAYPDTALTPAQARERLGIGPRERVVLAFGYLTPYKGVDLLLGALERLRAAGEPVRVILAGSVKKGQAAYWEGLQERIRSGGLEDSLLLRIGFIPDAEVELYFKAADALVLPYRHIFQSAVLVLAYNFGLPVLASDVGSFAEDVRPGETGFIHPPGDPEALATAIREYFASELYRDLPARRPLIRAYARERHSWETIAARHIEVYRGVLSRR